MDVEQSGTLSHEDNYKLCLLKTLLRVCRPTQRIRGKQPWQLYCFTLSSGRIIEVSVCEFMASRYLTFASPWEPIEPVGTLWSHLGFSLEPNGGIHVRTILDRSWSHQGTSGIDLNFGPILE